MSQSHEVVNLSPFNDLVITNVDYGKTTDIPFLEKSFPPL